MHQLEESETMEQTPLPPQLLDYLVEVYVRLRKAQRDLPTTGDIVLRQHLGRICYELDAIFSEFEKLKRSEKTT